MQAVKVFNNNAVSVVMPDGDCGRQNVMVVDVHEFVSEHAANLTFVKRL